MAANGSLTHRTVHHWAHNAGRASVHVSAASLVLPTALNPDGDLQLVAGFEDLGSFSIPRERSSTPETHALLSTFARSWAENGQLHQGVDVDKAVVKNIVAGLRAADAARQQTSEDMAELRLYSIDVGTRAEDALAVGNADAMVWNWAKPDSLYLTQGSWYATLDEAVVDGAWRAGRGFSISVEVVGAEGKIRMFEPGSGR